MSSLWLEKVNTYWNPWLLTQCCFIKSELYLELVKPPRKCWESCTKKYFCAFDSKKCFKYGWNKYCWPGFIQIRGWLDSYHQAMAPTSSYNLFWEYAQMPISIFLLALIQGTLINLLLVFLLIRLFFLNSDHKRNRIRKARDWSVESDTNSKR